MKLTQGARDCLIAYSRKPDNLPSALAIGAIQDDLRSAIRKEFQDDLCDYVRDGLSPSWSINNTEHPDNWAKRVWILSLKRKGSDGEIGVTPNDGPRLSGRTLLRGRGGPDEPAFSKNRLEADLHGLQGSNLDWCRYFSDQQPYTLLFSDEALIEMDTKEGRREFVKHYGDELLKTAEAIETLIRRGPK